MVLVEQGKVRAGRNPYVDWIFQHVLRLCLLIQRTQSKAVCDFLSGVRPARVHRNVSVVVPRNSLGVSSCSSSVGLPYDVSFAP
jgi:hypothetical protein